MTGVCSRCHMQMGALQVMCTCLFSRVGVCGILPSFILYCQSYMTCKNSYGLVIRFGDGNHSNLGSNPNRIQRSFAQKITFLRCHYYVLLHHSVLLQIIITYHYVLLHNDIVTYYYYVIITYYYILMISCYYILLQNHCYIIIT